MNINLLCIFLFTYCVTPPRLTIKERLQKKVQEKRDKEKQIIDSLSKVLLPAHIEKEITELDTNKNTDYGANKNQHQEEYNKLKNQYQEKYNELYALYTERSTAQSELAKLKLNAVECNNPEQVKKSFSDYKSQKNNLLNIQQKLLNVQANLEKKLDDINQYINMDPGLYQLSKKQSHTGDLTNAKPNTADKAQKSQDIQSKLEQCKSDQRDNKKQLTEVSQQLENPEFEKITEIEYRQKQITQFDTRIKTVVSEIDKLWRLYYPRYIEIHARYIGLYVIHTLKQEPKNIADAFEMLTDAVDSVFAPSNIKSLATLVQNALPNLTIREATIITKRFAEGICSFQIYAQRDLNIGVRLPHYMTTITNIIYRSMKPEEKIIDDIKSNKCLQDASSAPDSYFV